jgi:hypothetical protein
MRSPDRWSSSSCADVLGSTPTSCCASADPLGLAPAFFAEIQALLETPWAVATFDFVFAQTSGERPADFESTLTFGHALTRLAARDPGVHKLTAEVQGLLKPCSAYRDRELVRRVLAQMAEA